ncbi:MAG: TonB-dependent receptor [Sphingomonas sp.]
MNIVSNINPSRAGSLGAQVGYGALAAALLFAAAPAYARPEAPQQAAPGSAAKDGAADDDIVVTGIRRSLSAAADLKRESSIVQDSITSEDLGKFPDSNVAEALQRIPGVSIDRNGGEGQFVTVRGFGPSFNTVLVNGRNFASDNAGREFSFDLLAAELINGADVYKSSRADVQEGGIGATVNIKTARPLDIGGFKGLLSAKGQYEQNSNAFSPQVFGLLSNTFAGDTLGLLAAVSYQRREAQINFTQNRGYLPGSTVGPTNAPLFTNVFAPRNQDTGRDVQSRERLGVNVTGQWRPVDTLTLTLDGLYNRFTVESDVRSLGSWFEPSSYTAAAIDSNRTVTSLTTSGNGDLIATSNSRFTTTWAAGLNADWQPTDKLTVKLDASWSRARNNSGGRNYFTVIGIPSRYSFQEAQGNGFPSVFGYSADLTNPNLGRNHIALRQGVTEAERVLEFKLDSEWKAESGALDAVRFGLLHTRRSKNNQLIQTNPNTLCLYCGYSTSAPASLLRPFTLGSFLGSNGRVPTVFQSYDPEAYFRFLESPAAAAAQNAALGLPPGTIAAQLARTNGYAAAPQPSSFRVSENNYAGYLDADFRGTLGGLPWFVNIGARYIHTEIQASGQQLSLLDLLPVQGDPTIYNAVFANGGAPISTTQRSSYDYFLPSVNVKIDITPRVILRLAGSRSLTRPQIQDLAPRTNFDVVRPASLDASGGNPNLLPYTSNNFDVSAEWYPTRTTTLAAAFFYKNVSNFIVQTRAAEVFRIANAGNLPIGNGITGPNAATFNVRRPRNADTATISGVELNLVHTFDYLPGVLSGLGTQLNATFVTSNASFDPNATSVSFALEGLGNSQNATVFYEKYGFGARFAYNRRERFLQNLVTPGQGGDPVFRRPFDQIDVRASYDITPKIQVFFEGINVLSNVNITTGRFDNQVLDFVDTGARYAFGFRANF